MKEKVQVDVSQEETYLDTVEKAAMGQLVSCINAGDICGARSIIGLLRELQIV